MQSGEQSGHMSHGLMNTSQKLTKTGNPEHGEAAERNNETEQRMSHWSPGQRRE